jgi:RNA polymerase sigma-70 factor (ECF subfamily)
VSVQEFSRGFDVVNSSEHCPVANITLTDEDLVRACANSKSIALWEEFIDRFHGLIAGAVCRALRRKGEASPALIEDLVQETYAKLYNPQRNVLGAFEPRHPGSARAFLRAVTMNLVYDHLRAIRHESYTSSTEAGASTENHLPLPLGDAGSAASVERRLFINEVDNVLAGSEALTAATDRLIFWRHYRLGMTAREISELPTINLSLKGVESALFRTMKLIRSHFAGSRRQSGIEPTQKNSQKGYRTSESL